VQPRLQWLLRKLTAVAVESHRLAEADLCHSASAGFINSARTEV
jgi:hypothetical protein